MPRLPGSIERFRTESRSTASMKPIIAFQATLVLFLGAGHFVSSFGAPNVVAWGANTHNQINVPVDLTNAIAITVGDTFSLGLRPNGTVDSLGALNYEDSSGTRQSS